LLDDEILYSIAEAGIIIKSWRRFHNTLRLHDSLGYKSLSPEVFIPSTARVASISALPDLARSKNLGSP
jgi:putative transposase